MNVRLGHIFKGSTLSTLADIVAVDDSTLLDDVSPLSQSPSPGFDILSGTLPVPGGPPA